MALSSSTDSFAQVLAKPTKTSNDLQQLIDQWHTTLTNNEESLLRHAQQLNDKQQALNKTTESFIHTQDFLSNLEENLQQFQISLRTLTKYNDELESNIEQLNGESKTHLPNIPLNPRTEQDRSVTYELMESVDSHLNELDQTMKQLNDALHINTDHSIVKTTDELQTCFQDIQTLQETLQQMKF